MLLLDVVFNVICIVFDLWGEMWVKSIVFLGIMR